MPAKAKILVIHGGGEGSYDYDRSLAKFVGEQVGKVMVMVDIYICGCLKSVVSFNNGYEWCRYVY